MPPIQIASLEQHLVLLAWLNRQFGYEHNRDLLANMKEAAEGFDAEGRSFVYHLLVSRGDAVSISPDALAQYDDNIRNHLHTINARRSEPITLRYFQYLAVLYAECSSMDTLTAEERCSARLMILFLLMMPVSLSPNLTLKNWPFGWRPAAAKPSSCTSIIANFCTTTIIP